MSTKKINTALLFLLPIVSYSTVVFADTWMGNGSIISYHGKKYANSSTAHNWPYGLTQDLSIIHPNTYTSPVAFFQWQLSSGCTNLRLDYQGSSPRANVTIGGWSSRENDLTFENITFPFIIGNSNANIFENITGSGWYVLAVSMLGSTSRSDDIIASCTDQAASTYFGTPIKGRAITLLDGTHHWNGTASIISGNFPSTTNTTGTDSENWPFGVTTDVTKVHPGGKPAVFFQWLSSQSCPNLKLTASGLPSSEKQVSLRYKQWNSPTYKTKDITLPYTLNGSSDPQWTVMGLYFKNPVNQVASVYATCNNSDSGSDSIFDVNPDNEKKDIRFEDQSHSESDQSVATDCMFDDLLDGYAVGAKYITTLCSTGILVGYKSGNKRLFKPYAQANWADVTKVIELTNNQNDARSECIGTQQDPVGTMCYMKRAEQRGFINARNTAMLSGEAYRYLAKVFWGRNFSQASEADAFLRSIGVLDQHANELDHYSEPLYRGNLARIALKSAKQKNRTLAYGIVPIKKTEDFKPLSEDEEIEAFLQDLFSEILSPSELNELFGTLDAGTLESNYIDEDLPDTSVTVPPAGKGDDFGKKLAETAKKEVGKKGYPYVVKGKTRAQALTRMVYKQEAKFDTPAKEEAHYKAKNVLESGRNVTKIPVGSKVFIHKENPNGGVSDKVQIGIALEGDKAVVVTKKGPIEAKIDKNKTNYTKPTKAKGKYKK